MSEISVLMPCYNAAPFVREAVRSVIQQTFTSWELVIVDDGSDDGSAQELDSVMCEFSQYSIVVVHLDHIGCANATKSAIQYSSAPLCTVLDADDKLDENSLGVITKYYADHPSVGYTWTRYLAHRPGGGFREGRSKALPSGMTLKEALLAGWWGGISQRAFRRSVYDTTPGLNSALPWAVDQQLAALFAALGCDVAHIPVVTYFHLQHAKQMSAVHESEQQACRAVILESLGGKYVAEW